MSQLDFENVDGLCVYSVVCQVVPVTDDSGCKKVRTHPFGFLSRYITSNCGSECTGFETAGAFFFVGIKNMFICLLLLTSFSDRCIFMASITLHNILQ